MKRIFVIGTLMCISLAAEAQEDEFRKEFEEFSRQANEEFESFRDKCNKEYADFIEEAWEEFAPGRAITRPKDETVGPVTFDRSQATQRKGTAMTVTANAAVAAPCPVPQPQPVEPMEEMVTLSVTASQGTETASFAFCGMEKTVRTGGLKKFRLDGVREKDIANAWKELSGSEYNNLVYDCLRIREEQQLCDWAYLQMLRELADERLGKDSNEATLLMAYIYCQSGYKMRLARDRKDRLHMLYATHHTVYEKPVFMLRGESYYPMDDYAGRLRVCRASFPREQSMSLLISREQMLAMHATDKTTRRSEIYPDVEATVSSNSNLMEFFSTYPTSMVGDNMMTRWAMYANVPMSESVKNQVYPGLRKAIEGCDQYKAVDKLLNYVQTGFKYERDEVVWGYDRAFFAEETLYYEYCDCEDRSILFTRLVRDLLGLKCILVYYPGHLASAVEITDGTAGDDCDGIMLDGRRFVIADGTYINAPVGWTMPNMDNSTAKAILLE